MKTIINNEIKETKQEIKNKITNQSNNYFDKAGNLIIEKQLINQIGGRLKAIDVIANEIKKALINGIDNDYAVIPGTQKPTLLQPGARKIALMLGLTTTYSEPKIQNNIVILKCELYSQNNKISESFAAENINKPTGKRTVGWELNKSIKIAQKRAFVGAILNIANLTKVFTQDMEDSFQTTELTQDEIKAFYEFVKKQNNLEGFVKWNVLKPLCEQTIINFNQKHNTNYGEIKEFSKEHYQILMTTEEEKDTLGVEYA